ncbi:MAG TPA: hypothetical protein ENI54_05475 [bacterium]|mgnify:CR=1 FL=1|nr:hypothetical protein [bacterium]
MNSMHIYCPFCGTPYDIDVSALPYNDVKARCRVCSNVFVINKNTGAVKERPDSGKEPVSGEKSDNENDAAQSAASEINAAVAKDEAVTAKDNKEKGKINSLQIITLVILIILFLIAVIEALIHFNIIDLSFLLKNIS